MRSSAVCAGGRREAVKLAMKLASRRTYDLILLDVQLPGMDGFELLTPKIRLKPPPTARPRSGLALTFLRRISMPARIP